MTAEQAHEQAHEQVQRFSSIQQAFPELNRQFHRVFWRMGVTTREAVATIPDHVLLSQREFGVRSLQRLRAVIPYTGDPRANTRPCPICGGTGRLVRR